MTALRWTVLMTALVAMCYAAPAFAEDEVGKTAKPKVETKSETGFEVNGKRVTIKFIDGKPMVTVSGGAKIEEKTNDGLQDLIEVFMKSGILKSITDDVDVSVRIGDHEHRIKGRKGQQEHKGRREHDGMSGRWHERIERLEIANRRLTAEVERLRKRVNSASGPAIHRGKLVPSLDDRLGRIEKLLKMLVSKNVDHKGRKAKTAELHTKRLTRTKRSDAQFLADMARRKAVLAAAKAERQSKMAKQHNDRLKASYERLREVMKKLEKQRKQLEQETKSK